MLPSHIRSLVLSFAEKVDASENQKKEGGEEKHSSQQNEHFARLGQSVTGAEQNGAVIYLNRVIQISDISELRYYVSNSQYGVTFHKRRCRASDFVIVENVSHRITISHMHLEWIGSGISLFLRNNLLEVLE